MKKRLILLLTCYMIFCFSIYQNNNLKPKTIKSNNIERIENTSISKNEIIKANNDDNNSNIDENLLAILSIKKINLKENSYVEKVTIKRK